MASDLIRKRIKFAGDVHKELLKAGWDLATATDFVNNIPDADAALVVHGEWKYSPRENITICSKCGYEHYLGTYHQFATNYCPNCGDDMRVGRWKGEGMGDYSCSLCGKVVSGNHREECPNCHAKMDGSEKE